MVVWDVVSVIILWFLLATVISYLVIPNQFVETSVLRTREIKRLARKLKGKTPEKTLRNVYNYVVKTYVGHKKRYKVLILPRLFARDIGKLLDKKNLFLACHVQNKIIITLLMNTGQFERRQIKRKQSVTRFLTIHQDLIVNTGKAKYSLNPFSEEFKKI